MESWEGCQKHKYKNEGASTSITGISASAALVQVCPGVESWKGCQKKHNYKNGGTNEDKLTVFAVQLREAKGLKLSARCDPFRSINQPQLPYVIKYFQCNMAAPTSFEAFFGGRGGVGGS